VTDDNGQNVTDLTSPSYVGREADENVLGTSVAATYIDDTGQTDTVSSAAVTLGEAPSLIAAGELAAWAALEVTTATRDSDSTTSGALGDRSLSDDGAANITSSASTTDPGRFGGLVLVAPSLDEVESFALSVTGGAAVETQSFTLTSSGGGSATGSTALSGIGVTGGSFQTSLTSTLAPLPVVETAVGGTVGDPAAGASIVGSRGAASGASAGAGTGFIGRNAMAALLRRQLVEHPR